MRFVVLSVVVVVAFVLVIVVVVVLQSTHTAAAAAPLARKGSQTNERKSVGAFILIFFNKPTNEKARLY